MLNKHGDYGKRSYDESMQLSFYYDIYDDMLNGNDSVTVAGMDFDAADVLYHLDPTAYHVGFNDYIASLMQDAEGAEREDLEELFY